MSYQNGMLQDAENAKNLNNVKWTQPNLKLATTSITNQPEVRDDTVLKGLIHVIRASPQDRVTV